MTFKLIGEVGHGVQLSGRPVSGTISVTIVASCAMDAIHRFMSGYKWLSLRIVEIVAID